jgi:hypothetical protein
MEHWNTVRYRTVRRIPYRTVPHSTARYRTVLRHRRLRTVPYRTVPSPPYAEDIAGYVPYGTKTSPVTYRTVLRHRRLRTVPYRTVPGHRLFHIGLLYRLRTSSTFGNSPRILMESIILGLAKAAPYKPRIFNSIKKHLPPCGCIGARSAR